MFDKAVLIVEGVASTPDPYLFTVAKGLHRLHDGATEWMRKGPDPMKFRASLPMPLHWSHDLTRKIGEVVAFGPTPEALNFSAFIASPGERGYDSELLEDVWNRIKAGTVKAVSIAGIIEDDRRGTWTVSELSVCEAEGRNPRALIQKITYPDGEVVSVAAPEPPAEPERAQPANEKAASERGAPTTYLGVWRADSTYRRSDEVTHRGLLFHCRQDGTTGDVPGKSERWQMKHKDLAGGGRGWDRRGPGEAT